MNCRMCGTVLPESDLLIYRNMPKSAQFFPEEKELEEECGVDIVLKQCPFCGLVQAAGKPVPYFRDVIRATGVSEEMRLFREKQYAQWVRQNHLTGKRIIEIGCGRGEYMAFMETTGVRAYGLEHLRESVVEARGHGHTVFQGYVEDEEYAIPEAPYDGFYIMNFLEHIPEPGSFLKGIYHNLTDGAYGIVEVPDFDMMLKRSLYSEFIQDHLSYFTRDALVQLLENNGFAVCSMESIWNGYILSAQVQKRKMLDVSGFQTQYAGMKKEMQEFLKQEHREDRRVAVWGAGHQALANLSLLEMGKEVECVADSAAFKQGKFTPATHIPIVAPDQMRNYQIQTVIIMAAGYSGEVAKIMDRDFPEMKKVIFGEEGFIKMGEGT